MGKINTSSEFTINHVSIAPPIGSITAYTLATSPPGWLICDGSPVSRVTYASLFAVIGVTFGPGNNSTTFNLPNYKGAFLRGTGTTGDYSGPSLNASQAHATQTHSHTASSVVTDPGHSHSQISNNDDFNNSGGDTYPASSNPSFAANDTGIDRTWTNINSSFTGVTVSTTVGNSTTSVNANETRPYNFGVNWIIKY
jgi:microcystin-dependent protein